MKQTLIALATASVLGFASAVTAEQELSLAQMDSVTAGGNAAAEAMADAFGIDTMTATTTAASVESLGNVAGQVGAIEIIGSEAMAMSEAAADGVSVAMSGGAGMTEGTLLSDTTSASTALSDAVNLMSMATAQNTSMASEAVLGRNASASSASMSAAALAD